jgi:hypothetical protein
MVVRKMAFYQILKKAFPVIQAQYDNGIATNIELEPSFTHFIIHNRVGIFQ